ncbi:hypothetical protein [Micromonospora sp. NPDC005413]|uniref:hypothetical protein n=1 Tax=Micromonospora sp. NPDC005413 TaxID=3154563 RepID=UPI0033BB1224
MLRGAAGRRAGARGHSGHLTAAPVGAVLRRAWFNVDRLWAGVLVAAGLVTLIRA